MCRDNNDPTGEIFSKPNPYKFYKGLHNHNQTSGIYGNIERGACPEQVKREGAGKPSGELMSKTGLKGSWGIL